MTAPKPASASKQLSALSDSMMMCRSYGHALYPAGDINIVRTARGKIVSFTTIIKCERGCGYERHDEVNTASWERTKAYGKYKNAEYLVHGQGRVDRRDVRKEQFNRLVARRGQGS